MEQNLACKTGL